MQTRTTVSQRFPSVEHLDMWRHQEDSITLSAATLTDNAQNGAVRIIFAAYNEFDELLVPTQRQNSTLRFINSKVISASLGKGKHVELREPVKITLKHLRTVNVSNPVCVFWNYTSKVWSWDGCWLVASNLTHSQCECDHLTNFALMMDEGQGEVAVTLTAVTDHITTIIACVATLVCVTVLMFAVVLTWRRFRVSNQCRSMLQKSGIPCFHKTKELSEKDKKQGNFYTVTPKMNGSLSEGGRPEANIEMNTEQQYFQHMIAMQKNQDTLGLNKASTTRRNTMSNPPTTEQETNLSEADLKKTTSIPEHNINQHRQSLTLNARRTLRMKSGCEHAGAATLQFGVHNDIIFPKKNNNIGRAMSPFNHIYMEIDKAEEGGAVYEALNQSERSETYMLSSVSDMSDEDFRRCSRQSSNRYAENKPLIRQNNLLSTISGVMGPQPQHPAMMGQPQHGGMMGQPQHTHRTSILSTISGLRYTDPSQPGQPSLNMATGEPIITLQNGEIIHGLNLNGEPIHTLNLTEDQIQALNLEALPSFVPQQEVGGGEAPLQVTTVNGNQFLCLNLAEEPANNTYVSAGDLQAYSSFSDTYIQGSELRAQGSELRGFNTASFVNQENVQPGHIQTPVHSQLVIQRVGTLPRQYAHPLAQI